MSFWIALVLLTLLTIYLIKHPPKKEESVEQALPKVKITVSTPTKKGESVLATLTAKPPEGVKGIHVAETEIEKWFRENPSLRDANKY